MKLTVILITTALLQSALATNAQRVSLHERRAPLKTIFQQIRMQTGYDFFYDREVMSTAKPVTINVNDVTLESALQQCFGDQPFTFMIEEKVVVIKPRPKQSPEPIVAIAALIDVHGRVVDEKGQALAGATITVKGTGKSTITDARGEFALQNVAVDAQLQISFIGYVNKMIAAKADLGTIALEASVSNLDAVQVIAYGTTTERLNVGSVTTVRSEDIKRQPVLDVLAALESNVPGLDITQVTGVAGDGYRIKIRGANSLTSGTSPLYIVDGVEMTNYSGLSQGDNPFSAMSPNDVESVSVLKDADATAIYGSRGGNGVILITTKKGKAGATRFNFNVYSGVNKYAHAPQLLNTDQYLEMRREAFKNDGVTPTLANAPDLFGYRVNSDVNRYTNWVQAILGQPGHTTDIQLSASGGDTLNTFMISAALHRESPPTPGNFSYIRPSVHFNFNHASKDRRFNIALTANYGYESNNFTFNVTGLLTSLPPNLPQQVNPDGTFNFTTPFSNPYALLADPESKQTKTLVSSAVLSYELAKGLVLKTNFGYTDMNLSDVTLYPLSTTDPAYRYTSGYSTADHNANNSWQIEPQLEYKTTIATGRLTALLGGTYEGHTTTDNYFYAQNFTNENQLEDLSAAGSLYVSDSYLRYRYLAAFARFSYNLQDKYLLDLTGRRDGSSRFGSGKQWGTFGAAGAGWIFSKEKLFTEAMPWLSFGKLRASYGVTGNDQIGDYQYLDTYSGTVVKPLLGGGTTDGVVYAGQKTLAPTSLYNSDYSWETTKKLEAGLDIGLFHDRVLLYLSWYRNRSSSQLINYSLPPTTGFSGILENLPATIGNSGIEVALTTTNIQGGKFGWRTGFNLSVPRNQLISFPNLATSSYANTYVIGQPINVKKVYRYLGVDPATGVYEFYDAKGNPTFTPTPIVDQKTLVNINKRFYGGLSNTFNYGQFQLVVDLQYVKQNGFNPLVTGIPNGLNYDFPTGILSRWQKPGDISNIQKFAVSSSSAAYKAARYAASSEIHYTDASYIRLKNVDLSYSFQSKFIEKIGIKSLRLNLSAQNLYTFTHYLGDPEFVGNGFLPPLRSIVAGLQSSF